MNQIWRWFARNRGPTVWTSSRNILSTQQLPAAVDKMHTFNRKTQCIPAYVVCHFFYSYSKSCRASSFVCFFQSNGRCIYLAWACSGLRNLSLPSFHGQNIVAHELYVVMHIVLQRSPYKFFDCFRIERIKSWWVGGSNKFAPEDAISLLSDFIVTVIGGILSSSLFQRSPSWIIIAININIIIIFQPHVQGSENKETFQFQNGSLSFLLQIPRNFCTHNYTQFFLNTKVEGKYHKSYLISYENTFIWLFLKHTRLPRIRKKEAHSHLVLSD